MWKPLLLIALMILVGVFGYLIIENMSPLDALYMTVITIFTVGFREVQDLSVAGRIFTIFIILGGAGTIIFAFTKLGEIIFEGGFRKAWWRHRMEKTLSKIKDHYIICGCGRMGGTVAERLTKEKVPFVVIDCAGEHLQTLVDEGKALSIVGDATQEDILMKAGIKRAKGLAALLGSDADNLYLTFTAKLINPSIYVLSRVMEEEAEKKILQIGANKVVRPYKETALKIAQGMIRPALVDFMDLIIRRQELSLVMEELVVHKNALLVDRNLRECDVRQKANVIVVAIKKPGEDIVFNPPSDFNLSIGDTLLVLGDQEEILRFEKIYLKAVT